MKTKTKKTDRINMRKCLAAGWCPKWAIDEHESADMGKSLLLALLDDADWAEELEQKYLPPPEEDRITISDFTYDSCRRVTIVLGGVTYMGVMDLYSKTVSFIDPPPAVVTDAVLEYLKPPRTETQYTIRAPLLA